MSRRLLHTVVLNPAMGRHALVVARTNPLTAKTSPLVREARRSHLEGN